MNTSDKLIKSLPPLTTSSLRATFKLFNTRTILKSISGVAASTPLVALLFILGVLIVEALPAIKLNGLGFLYQSQWKPGNAYATSITTHGILHPAGASYGALPLIVGTIESAIIAMAIAVPVSIGAAIVVVHKLPNRLSHSIGFFLETLAGIPSVIYGLWGALTLGPILANHVFPKLSRLIPNLPGLDFFRGSVGHGEGLLTSSIVLAIMVIPIIASTTRDLLRSVPPLAEDGALALGMTEREMIQKVSLRWIGSGIVGASVLGLARALGETMAVAMISGSILGALPQNVYSTFTTIAATIVSQLDSALSDGTGFAIKTLAEAALVLMVLTLLSNVAARILVRRVASTALPVGRGI